MPTYAELIEIIKVTEIREYSHYIKSKRIDFLIKRGLYLKNMILTNK